MLLSLGYKLGGDPVSLISAMSAFLVLQVNFQTNDPVFEKIFEEIDPNNTGYVPFETFLDFMTKVTVD